MKVADLIKRFEEIGYDQNTEFAVCVIHKSDKDIKNYERTLAIRGLLFTLDEDYDTHLKLAKICRREDRFTTCMIVLNRLSKRLENCGANVSVNVKLSISKCLNENERLVLKYRYYDSCTQSNTAKLLNMTQVQVSRTEKRILLKMRQIIGEI